MRYNSWHLKTQKMMIAGVSMTTLSTLNVMQT